MIQSPNSTDFAEISFDEKDEISKESAKDEESEELMDETIFEIDKESTSVFEFFVFHDGKDGFPFILN